MSSEPHPTTLSDPSPREQNGHAQQLGDRPGSGATETCRRTIGWLPGRQLSRTKSRPLGLPRVESMWVTTPVWRSTTPSAGVLGRSLDVGLGCETMYVPGSMSLVSIA